MSLGQSHVRGDHLPSRSSDHHGYADLSGRKPSCSLRTSGPCWKRKAIYKQRGTAAAWTDRTEPNCKKETCSSVPWQVSFKSNRLSSKNRCDNKQTQIRQLRVKRILRRHLRSRRARIPWIGKLKRPSIPKIQIPNIYLSLCHANRPHPAYTYRVFSPDLHRPSQMALPCTNVPAPQHHCTRQREVNVCMSTKRDKEAQ